MPQRIILLMTLLMLVGISISLFISPEISNNHNSIFDLLRIGMKNIPAWFGAIAGIFGSTLLSYFYALDKQKRDDLKKEHEKNIENASKILITIAGCIEQLKSIKHVYMRKIENQTSIQRSFRSMNLVHGELTAVSIDAASLSFLVKPKEKAVFQLTASNPVFIQTAIGQYNDILALMKEKKAMSDRLITTLYESKGDSQSFNLSFEPSYFLGKKTFHDIMNFIRLSECFFKTVDESIDTLSSIAIDLSREMKLYVKEHNLTETFLSYENESHIFARPPQIDVEKEIEALINRCMYRGDNFNIENWPIFTASTLK
ncbi:hypothetical protein [Aeromonas sp. JL9]|uniref:hypothetical protein n=1 Tax=Aeromonas sp. JL9 TaxID=2950549 RepID=UPI00210A7D07|nr:hypothetical protein [Aeromonas sp. JL9]MCQ4109264.1 hypothetical protein [Aeromonas sp. JL9]